MEARIEEKRKGRKKKGEDGKANKIQKEKIEKIQIIFLFFNIHSVPCVFFFFLNLFLFFFQAFHPLFSLLPDPDIAMRKEGLSKDRENSRQRAHPSRFTKPGSHQLAQTTIFSPVVKFLFDYSLVTAITSFSQNIYVRELIRK